MAAPSKVFVVEIPTQRIGKKRVANADDDASFGSFSTVLSERTFESEDSSDSEETDDELDRLQEEFALRKKLLKRILKGMDQHYIRMIEQNEEAVRTETLRLFHRKEKRREMVNKNASEQKTDDNGETNEISHSTGKARESNTQGVPASHICSGFLRNMRLSFLFEAHNTVPGCVALILYCLSHLSLYELVSAIILECTRTVHQQNLLNGCILVIGLFLSRLGGGIWHYVEGERYQCIKFDMHNRLRLGKKDALMLYWFRKHPRAKAVVNLLGFYLALFAVAHFQYRLMGILDFRQGILEGLPSAKSGISTHVVSKLSFGLTDHGLNRSLGGGTCADEICNLSSLHTDLVLEDEIYACSRLSVSSCVYLVGYGGAHAVSATGVVGYYIVSACVAIFILKSKFGINFAI